MGISPYPLNNRRFTCLLVPPKGVHSTISNIGRDSRYRNTWIPGGRNSLSERRRMRTKNKDKELNHRHFIGLRLTDVELDLLDQGAACLSVSRSEYLRKLLLEKQIHHQIEVVADMNDLRKLVSEYGKIGSNLNQIAKHFNSGGSQSRAIENEIHQCITDLFLLRKEVLKLAGGMNGNRKTH